MSKWISVKERLPEDDKLKVVKYAKKDGRYIGIALSRRYTPSNMNKPCWCFEFASTQNTYVSYWADLPTD